VRTPIKERCIKILLFLLMGSAWHRVIASPFVKHSTVVFQAGGFNASQGEAQDINIAGLIGNHYSLGNGHDNNILLGLGYFVDGLTKNNLTVLYGINAFYFGPTSVNGKVIQEQMFTNLAYHYSLNNFPVYAAVKMFLTQDQNDVTFDLGIGPNFIRASSYNEKSLDGITVPDNAFTGETNTALSFTAGVGVKFNHLLSLPCELSYRFFYLGEGSLKKNNSQLLDTLKTGNNYANALIFSIYA